MMAHYLFAGIYGVAAQDEINDWQGALISLENGTWPQPYYLSVPVAPFSVPTADEFHAITAFIHQQRQQNRPVLIYAPSGVPHAAVGALAYLLEYVHMRLPDAYILISNYTPLKPPPHEWVYALSEAYALGYPAALLNDRMLPVNMAVACAGTIHPIDRGIYISNIAPMTEHHRARELGIEAVLRVDSHDRAQKQWPADFILCDLPLKDARLVSSAQIKLATAFLHEQVQAERRVLAHCQEGISRSVTLVLAYLIEYAGLTLAEAARLVVRRRPMAEPHPFLIESLVRTYDLPYGVEQVHDWNFFYRIALQ